jgi:hypothetical protein
MGRKLTRAGEPSHRFEGSWQSANEAHRKRNEREVYRARSVAGQDIHHDCESIDVGCADKEKHNVLAESEQDLNPLSS